MQKLDEYTLRLETALRANGGKTPAYIPGFHSILFKPYIIQNHNLTRLNFNLKRLIKLSMQASQCFDLHMKSLAGIFIEEHFTICIYNLMIIFSMSWCALEVVILRVLNASRNTGSVSLVFIFMLAWIICHVNHWVIVGCSLKGH